MHGFCPWQVCHVRIPAINLENLEVTIPKFVDPGDYYVFVGMGNKIRTRSIYLGDVEVINP